MDLLFIKLHRYREGQSSYVIHADYAKNQMLLSENQFDVGEDVEHLLAVSRDGDADAVVSYFPLGLSE